MKVRVVTFVVAAAAVLFAAAGPKEQIDRGRELFLHSEKGTACATCHVLEGQGTAVGPDLTRLGGGAARTRDDNPDEHDRVHAGNEIARWQDLPRNSGEEGR
jgi:mono/diheme cytochrome c family protein